MVASELALVETLTPRQLLALYADIAGRKPAAIAREVCVAADTVRRWQALPAYKYKRQELLDEIESRRVQQVVDHGVRLDSMVGEAIDTLESLHKDADVESNVRRGAANDIIDLAPHGPRRQKNAAVGAGEGVTLQIGQGVFTNVIAALRDTDRADIISLVQGVDGAYLPAASTPANADEALRDRLDDHWQHVVEV